MNLLDITLVILSHNRQHCLKKTLAFYKSINIHLLVLDNSPSPLDDRYIPENCEYVNVDLPFAQRAAMAASLIRSAFTIIGADDEIYLPASLEKMRDFLIENPDYVAAGGYAIAVWQYGPTIAASWAYNRTYKYHNNQSSSLERIKLHTGNGINPLTSFFTCNLTRTWAAQNCLNMYSKAPVLATDAISVLTICGAGKSKYLDLVYWIRNWNQSPRSHSGWDRRVFLHEWWEKPENEIKRKSFLEDLKSIYLKTSSNDDFLDSWSLILKSDQTLQHRISPVRNIFRILGERKELKYLKFYIKKLVAPSKLPHTVGKLSKEMGAKGILIPESELLDASLLVSKILPYESW